MSKKDYQSWVEFLATKGEKVKIVESGGVPDDIDVIVCRLAPAGEKLMMPDNLVGHCATCWRMIQFRPHAPKVGRRICDECARPEMAAREKSEGVKYLITENTMRDLADFARRKKLS